MLSLTETVLSDSERRHQVAQDIRNRAYNWGWDKISALRHIVGTLQGLRDDYENGFLEDLEVAIVANISSEYMAQVDEILTAGLSNTYDHIFAAAMCGAVLEDALRRLCARQKTPVETLKPNGKPKRLDALIPALQKANAYNALEGRSASRLDENSESCFARRVC